MSPSLAGGSDSAVVGEARLSGSTLSSLPGGLMVCDRELRCRVWNAWLEEASGVPAAQVIGHRVMDAIPQLRAQGLDGVLERALAGDTVQLPDVRYAHPRTGEVRWITGTLAPHRDERGETLGVVGSVHEVTDRKHAEERLEHDALHDPLTGLPNRALFMDRLDQALERGKRRPDHLFAVLFVDLDRFKSVNDSLGHAAGDELLRTVARRLQESLRSIDTVARLGGDEFAVLIEQVEGPGDATRAASRILTDVSAPFELQGRPLRTTASIGITLGARHYEHGPDLLRDADIAMYRAKAQGRGRHQVFDRSMNERAVHLLRLESELRRALEQQQLRLHYQPMVALDSGRIVGLEALVRWAHPERGLLRPEEFLPLAEETGLVVPLGRWTVREACRQLVAWIRMAGADGLAVSVNLSSKQFAHDGLAAEVEEVLRETGAPAGRLALEVTERCLMEDPEHAGQVVAELQALGVRLVLDDFGTGYSSLTSLHRFRLHGLKIDRAHIARVGEPVGRDMVRSALVVAQSLSLEAVAEGVQTAEQLDLLRALGCAVGQGDHLAPAQEADQAGALVRSGRIPG